MSGAFRIGVDVGGTFTDLALDTGDGTPRIFKVPSTPKDPSVGVLAVVAAAARGLGLADAELLGRCEAFIHGSTVATNTVLERKGAKVGLLTTFGFRDSLEIRRGIRDNPWDHRTPFPDPLVPRRLRLGVRGRMDAAGREVEPLALSDVGEALALFTLEGVEAVAVCFLNSYLNGAHEEATQGEVERLLPGMPVSLSSHLAPVMGEYERSSTAVIDAFVRRRVTSYVAALEARLRALGFRGRLALIQSNGGAASVTRIARAPVAVCLSGPAAGVGAMRHFGRLCGSEDVLAMEIGGTSCDVTMLRGGRPQLVGSFMMDGFHVATPAVEIHTVGAGGGSIAEVDGAGLLHCGPRGAGAAPGPACYGRGGSDPTTTDALVVIGRMRPGPIGDGSISLDPERARAACQDRIARPLGVSAEEAAIGIVRLLEQNLLQAVEEISVKRGFDPARFTLIAAGGAGPMHGAAVGRALGCRTVYVPRDAGAFCALGMLHGDIRQDFLRVQDASLDDKALQALAPAIADLRRTAVAELSSEGFDAALLSTSLELDLHYKAQLRSLRVPYDPEADDAAGLKARFEGEHGRIYGHVKPITPVRMSALRLVATAPGRPLAARSAEPVAGTPEPSGYRRAYLGGGRGWAEIPVFSGDRLSPGHAMVGPLLIEERTTTIFAGPGDAVAVDPTGDYRITLG